MNKESKKAARQEKLAEEKQVRGSALKAGLAILTMYAGCFAYFGL